MDNISASSYFFNFFCYFFPTHTAFVSIWDLTLQEKDMENSKQHQKKEVEVEIVVLRRLLETTTQV